MTNPTPFSEWLEDFCRLFRQGEEYTRTQQASPVPAPVALPVGEKPLALLFAPHPDDEALAAPLPLRLAESGAAVLAVACTLGSDCAKKKTRQMEFAASCAELGFSATACDRIDVQELASLFEQYSPALVMAPHAHDLHPTHEKMARLVTEALQRHCHERGKEALLTEWEYWHPMKNPNLLLGIQPTEAARVIAALCRHQGEISRNPYHLRLPGRWLDTVRRGSELVDGMGGPAPAFLFGDTYRISLISKGIKVTAGTSHIISPDQSFSIASLRGLFFPEAATSCRCALPN